MLRPLLACALLALTASACDSTGNDTQPLGGILFVSLEGASTLRLESNIDLPCGPKIVTEQQTNGGRFTVQVLGVESVDAGCTALGRVTTTVPIQAGGQDPLPVDLVFGGFVDEYRYTRGSGTARLDSVRYNVSCLGARPAQIPADPVCRLLK